MMVRKLVAAVALSLASVSSLQAQVTLWNNGGFSTGPTTRSGFAAPAGTTFSEVPDGNTNAGSTVSIQVGQEPSFRLQDNFTLSEASTLTSITTYAYSTGSAIGAGFTGGNIQIWSGRPGDVGSTVVFGDTTTNRLLSSTFTNIFRVFGSTSTTGGVVTVPTATNIDDRAIKDLIFDTPIFLNAGEYWIDWQGTGFATAFGPYVTDLTRGAVGANGRQMTNATTFADLFDTGSPATLPDVLQDIPFIVTGTPIPEPTSMTLMGLAVAGYGVRRWKKKK